MGFLLDTCVISEFVSRRQERSVVEWLNSQPLDSLFLAAFSIGEIRTGIARLQPSKRKSELEEWLDRVKGMFRGRIYAFDLSSAERWGQLMADKKALKRTLPIVDTFIAAIAIQHGHIVATRNVRDFEIGGVSIFNPWEYVSENSDGK